MKKYNLQWGEDLFKKLVTWLRWYDENNKQWYENFPIQSSPKHGHCQKRITIEHPQYEEKGWEFWKWIPKTQLNTTTGLTVWDLYVKSCKARQW